MESVDIVDLLPWYSDAWTLPEIHARLDLFVFGDKLE